MGYIDNFDPIVKIFAIISGKRVEISDKIIKFKYTYSEDKDDCCEITLKSDDPNIADKPELSENAKLIVQWGYISKGELTSRTIFIWDQKPSFAADGVTLNIKGYDKFASAKTNTSKRTMTNSSMYDWANTIAKDYGLNANDGGAGGTGLIARWTPASPGNPSQGNAFPTPIDNTVDSQLKISSFQLSKPDTNNKDYSNMNLMKFIKDSVKRDDYPQAGKSDYQILREQADLEPDGPYVVTGRDEDLIIKKRDFNQAPIRVYVYKKEGKPFISFDPETKNKQRHNSKSSISNNFDPMTGSYSEVGMDGFDDDNVRIGDGFDLPSTDRSANFIYPSNLNEAQKSVLRDIEEREKRRESRKLDINYISNSDNARSQNALDGTLVTPISTTATTVTKFNVYERAADTIVSNEHDLESAKTEVENRRRDQELKKNPGEILLELDQALQEGKIINIQNVSRKYSGNYYITEAEHEIVFGSFARVTCRLVRNSTNAVNKSSADIADKPVNKNPKADNNLSQKTTLKEYISSNQ